MMLGFFCAIAGCTANASARTPRVPNVMDREIFILSKLRIGCLKPVCSLVERWYWVGRLKQCDAVGLLAIHILRPASVRKAQLTRYIPPIKYERTADSNEAKLRPSTALMYLRRFL